MSFQSPALCDFSIILSTTNAIFKVIETHGFFHYNFSGESLPLKNRVTPEAATGSVLQKSWP